VAIRRKESRRKKTKARRGKLWSSEAPRSVCIIDGLDYLWAASILL